MSEQQKNKQLIKEALHKNCADCNAGNVSTFPQNEFDLKTLCTSVNKN